jgi:hypothetical protein
VVEIQIATDASSDTGTVDQAVTICDGSSGLRFAAIIPWGGPVEYATGVLYERGAAYILIDGQCEYTVWAINPMDPAPGCWSAARRGVMEAGTEAEIAEAFAYSTWAAMDGWHGPDYGGMYDVPFLLLSDGEHGVACQSPCEVSAPAIAAALQVMLEWMDRLYEAGEDLDGPLRLRVFESEYQLGNELVEWPLVRPPSEYLSAEHPTVLSGPAAIIDDPDEASLRALRTALFARVEPSSPAQSAHVVTTMSYLYAFRDVIRFENADGEIPELIDMW